MPAIVLSPLAWNAVRLGAMLAVTAYVSRRRGSQPKDVLHEQTLEGLPDGVNAHSHRAEAERGLHGTARVRRTVRLGPGGPRVEIDAAGLGRLRFRRVD